MLMWLMNLGFAGGDGSVTPPPDKTFGVLCSISSTTLGIRSIINATSGVSCKITNTKGVSSEV